jgi:putative ABC transport system permease protein
MKFRTGNIRLAMQSVGATKFRSLLTMLGIVIGVVAVILVISVGEGVKRQISQQTLKYGDNVFIIRPLAEQRSVLSGESLPLAASAPLTNKDLETIRAARLVTSAVPLASVSGSVTGEKTIDTPFVIATTPEFAALVKPQIKFGGFFESSDGTAQVVLGSRVVDKLYEDSMPLGQALTYRGGEFLVTGVFKNFNAPPLSMESNFNNAIFIPYSSVRELLGTDPLIYEIIASVQKGTDMTAYAKELQQKIEDSRGGAKDVTVTIAGQRSVGSDRTVNLLTSMTLVAALVAFVVGGVGIMNMMFVTVTERTHEIGIRKAIGASNQQIMHQFIAEAFVLSVIGTVLGVVGALAGIGLLRLYTTLQPVLIWQVFVATSIVAVFSGVLFGSIPALKAARKDPIQALRRTE